MNGTSVSSYALSISSADQYSYQQVLRSGYNLNYDTRIAKLFIGSTVDTPVVARLIWSESTIVRSQVLNYIPSLTLAGTINITGPNPTRAAGATETPISKSAIHYEISIVLLGFVLSMLNF